MAVQEGRPVDTIDVRDILFVGVSRESGCHSGASASDTCSNRQAPTASRLHVTDTCCLVLHDVSHHPDCLAHEPQRRPGMSCRLGMIMPAVDGVAQSLPSAPWTGLTDMWGDAGLGATVSITDVVAANWSRAEGCTGCAALSMHLDSADARPLVKVRAGWGC